MTAIKAKSLGDARVRTGLVRFSFVHVFEPQKRDDGSDIYNATILIQKDDKDTLKAIETAINAAKEKGIQEQWGGKLPKKYADPLHDGEDKEDTYEGFDGVMYLNAKSNRRPKVVDKHLDPILDAEDFYSGCYGIVTLSFWPYNRQGNVGVSVSLDNIMKVKDGERLGGGAASVEADFEGLGFDDDEDDDEL